MFPCSCKLVGGCIISSLLHITPFSVGVLLHASNLASAPMSMVCLSNPFCILVDCSISCSYFDLLAGFSFYARGRFSLGPPFFCSSSTILWNVCTASSILLSSLCKFIVLFLSSSRTLFLSWVMSLSITVHYTWVFRRIFTSGNTAAKLADNEVRSIVYS